MTREEGASRRRIDWLLVATAIASVLPLFAVDYLPFTDLPEHVAVMASLRHWFDPVWRIQEHYVFAYTKSQYLLYHAIGALLGTLTGVETANRLMLAAVGIAFPFSLRSLLRSLDRDERLAIFACPLFWNRALLVGFLPFVASMPVLLGVLALAVRYARAHANPSRRSMVVLAVVSTLLFYVHASAYTLLIVLAPAMSAVILFGDRALRALPRTLVWILPGALLAAFWTLTGSVALHGTSAAAEGETGRMGVLRSMRAISLWSHDIWRSHIDEIGAVAFWALFAVLLVAFVRRPRRESMSRSERALEVASYLPFLLTFVTYVALPFRIGAGFMLNVRLAPFLAFFAILALPSSGEGLGERLGRWVPRLVALVALATSADAAFEIRAIAREDMAGFDTLIDRMRPGARVALLNFVIDSPRSHFPPWVHAGAYHRIRHGGVASFSFSELRHWPLRYREGAAPPPKPPFWDFAPCVFRNGDDGPYYDYVLTRGGLDPFRDRPPGPAWRRVADASAFVLWEKIPGESYGPWTVPDLGPCVSRAEAEKSAEAPASSSSQ